MRGIYLMIDTLFRYLQLQSLTLFSRGVTLDSAIKYAKYDRRKWFGYKFANFEIKSINLRSGDEWVADGSEMVWRIRTWAELAWVRIHRVRIARHPKIPC